MRVWLAKAPTYKDEAAEGRQVFPQVSYVHSPGRMFSGGHRFIMSERVERKTWKTLEGIQHALSLGEGLRSARSDRYFWHKELQQTEESYVSQASARTFF